MYAMFASELASLFQKSHSVLLRVNSKRFYFRFYVYCFNGEVLNISPTHTNRSYDTSEYKI